MHAFRCAELAGDARNPQLKSTFLELAANWQKLARDLEQTQQLLAQDAAELAWQSTALSSPASVHREQGSSRLSAPHI